MDDQVLQGLLRSLPSLRELAVILHHEGDNFERLPDRFQRHQANLRSLSILGPNTVWSIDRTFGRGFAKLAFLQHTIPLTCQETVYRPGEQLHEGSTSRLWEAHHLKEINLLFKNVNNYCDPVNLASWLDQRISPACIVSFTPAFCVYPGTKKISKAAQWQQDSRTAHRNLIMRRQPAQPGWEKIS